MEKDTSILELLDRLSVELSKDFIIVDFWAGNLCAIGIIRGSINGRLVYMSTFNQSPNCYYYEYEVADSVKSIEKGDYTVVRKGQVTHFSAMVEVAKTHLYNEK